jgi:hypothetical protein
MESTRVFPASALQWFEEELTLFKGSNQLSAFSFLFG